MARPAAAPRGHFAIPGVYFFAKNKSGHLMFASQGLLQRYQMRDDSEFIGRTDFDINPDTMANPLPYGVT